MTKGNCPTVNVHLALLEAQFALANDRLGGKGFVNFDQVKLVGRHVNLGEQLLGGRQGADPHQFRLDPGQGTGLPVAEDFLAFRQSPAFAH